MNPFPRSAGPGSGGEGRFESRLLPLFKHRTEEVVTCFPGPARRWSTAHPVPARPTAPDLLLASPAPVSARPCDGEEKRAVSKGLDVMSQALVECEETACGQIEHAFERANPDVATDGVDGDASLRLMPRNTGVRFEYDQDNAEVVVLHERLDVLATRRLEFAVELLELSREIEFQKGGGHGLRVRSPVLTVFVTGV